MSPLLLFLLVIKKVFTLVTVGYIMSLAFKLKTFEGNSLYHAWRGLVILSVYCFQHYSCVEPTTDLCWPRDSHLSPFCFGYGFRENSPVH